MPIPVLRRTGRGRSSEPRPHRRLRQLDEGVPVVERGAVRPDIDQPEGVDVVPGGVRRTDLEIRLCPGGLTVAVKVAGVVAPDHVRVRRQGREELVLLFEREPGHERHVGQQDHTISGALGRGRQGLADERQGPARQIKEVGELAPARPDVPGVDVHRDEAHALPVEARVLQPELLTVRRRHGAVRADPPRQVRAHRVEMPGEGLLEDLLLSCLDRVVSQHRDPRHAQGVQGPVRWPPSAPPGDIAEDEDELWALRRGQGLDRRDGVLETECVFPLVGDVRVGEDGVCEDELGVWEGRTGVVSGVIRGEDTVVAAGATRGGSRPTTEQACAEHDPHHARDGTSRDVCAATVPECRRFRLGPGDSDDGGGSKRALLG